MNTKQNLDLDEDKEEILSIDSSDPFDLNKNFAYFNSNKNKEKIDEEIYFKSEEMDQIEINKNLNLDGENSNLGAKKFGDNFSSENLSSNMKEFDDISYQKPEKLNLNDSNNISTSKKNSPLNPKGKEKNIFTCIYPKNIDFISLNTIQINNDMISKKREREKKIYEGTKLMDNYNIKSKILTHFLNKKIFKKINIEIKKIDSKFYIYIFPRVFILSLIAKARQKESFKLTLEELYKKSNHRQNLETLKKLRSDEYKNIMEKSDLNKLLKTKIADLYKEYLNSDEFNDDIENFKKTIGNDYAEKYANVAKQL